LALPWRFAVTESGIGLWFGFRKYRYVEKQHAVIRAGRGSPVVFCDHTGRFGYPLTDGLVDRDRLELRALLAALGFRLTA
jgi:hypothetical protein